MWRLVLLPVSFIFGLGIRIRHFLFNIGILSSKSYEMPIISVGNLSLGGSGKTPHTEYLVRLLLKEKKKIAILSRGYGRKTKGYFKATPESDSTQIGDEPTQFQKKFGKHITLAVDGSRREGIETLMKEDKDMDVILLDDAMQHRFVKPGFSILLTDYRKLYSDDYLFPAGGLRDVKSAARRADVIIVSKTERMLSPIVRKDIHKKLNVADHQKLYFSYLHYDKLVSLHDFERRNNEKKYSIIVLFSGVANSYPLKDYLRYRCRELISLDFPDHHYYTRKDVELIARTYEDQFTRNKAIITTEKDAMRLINSPYLRILEDLPVYFLPIEVKFHGEDGEEFNDQILKYVRENPRKR
ncbi:MAG: tetraacyldisaccharide 4'-kinase [Bacteroidales bacterium]|nr:tetraacyldisaccharide 4'-kinase [Bacteroidales bacterium]